MATAPKINYPDSSGTTTSLVITTNSFGLIFTGTVDSNIIDIQIDINGAGFISNPSLIELALPNFTIPNLNVYPEGLELELGQNLIRLRSIDISGAVSPISTITVNVIPTSDFDLVRPSPTGIRLQRNAGAVYVQWSDVLPSEVTGFNIYASTGSGGTGSGYLRINKDLISADSPTEVVREEISLSTNETTIINPYQSDPFDSVIDPGADSANLYVRAQTLNSVTNDLIEEVSRNSFPLLNTPSFRLNVQLAGIVENNFFSFKHDRNDGIVNGILSSDVFSAVSPEDPVYYVVTAVYYDSTTGQMQESRYSQEIAGSPLPLDTTVRGIRVRDQRAINRDYILEVQKEQPTLSMIPGSTIREVHIEPFSNEVYKAYVLMDFVHRAHSFAALLQIDDPGLTGTSIDVANSAYKQNLKTALSLSSDAAVQSLIDGAFSSLAANFDVTRLGRRQSVVNQTFFTTTKPTTDLVIAQDAVVRASGNQTAPRFRASGAAVLPAANAQAFYNPDKRRYEIKLQLIAEVPGSIGNIPADELDTIVSGANGFQTINEEATHFGRDVQTNLELAETALRKLSSLDTGTEGGYELLAIGTPGLIEVRVVKSGDPDMMRDYDDVRGKHIGGKVDIWVKGTIERTVTETFAFQFDIAKNIRFDVIDPINLVFRARDSRLTVNNPIQEMLYNPSQNLGLRNQSLSPTQEYDLTGVEIVDYRTIRLSTSIPQPLTLLDDFAEGDYRYRSNNRFIASLQPILRITSVVGEVSGAIDSSDGFTLYKTQDPLLEGESTLSQDYVEINQIDNIPTGTPVTVNMEEHTMIGQFEEPLNSVGINTFTLHVYDQDRLVEYNGPDDPNPDFLIVGGSQTSPIKIVRTTYSNIPNGSVVSVDYEKDENFVVTYVINDVLQRLQTIIENGVDGGKNGRHVTADVLVKQAIENPMLIESTVQLIENADQGDTDSEIRTGISVLTDSRGVGGAIRISDMVKVYEDSNGLDFVVQPFTRHTLMTGAKRIRDKLPSDYTALPSLNAFSNAVYILDEPLPYDTKDSGGDSTIHYGVFMDELIMEKASSLNDVGLGVNRSWIIGKNGAVITGYSDDATLYPEFITATAVAAERLRRTANKIVVSLNAGISPPDVPSDHSFSASYVVDGDTGSKDIVTSQVEFITPGSVTITYRPATSSS